MKTQEELNTISTLTHLLQVLFHRSISSNNSTVLTDLELAVSKKLIELV